MLRWPWARRVPMARLRRLAMARGAVPVRSWEASSAKVVSRMWCTTPRVKRLRQASPYPPDYALFRPFEIAPATERAAGVVAVALVVVAVVVLDVASPDRRRRRT